MTSDIDTPCTSSVVLPVRLIVSVCCAPMSLESDFRPDRAVVALASV